MSPHKISFHTIFLTSPAGRGGQDQLRGGDEDDEESLQVKDQVLHSIMTLQTLVTLRTQLTILTLLALLTRMIQPTLLQVQDQVLPPVGVLLRGG